jgi:hypothetical protein
MVNKAKVLNNVFRNYLGNTWDDKELKPYIENAKKQISVSFQKIKDSIVDFKIVISKTELGSEIASLRFSTKPNSSFCNAFRNFNLEWISPKEFTDVKLVSSQVYQMSTRKFQNNSNSNTKNYPTDIEIEFVEEEESMEFEIEIDLE